MDTFLEMEVREEEFAATSFVLDRGEWLSQAGGPRGFSPTERDPLGKSVGRAMEHNPLTTRAPGYQIDDTCSEEENYS